MDKRYKLLKDLPTFKAGDEFFISKDGNLIAGTPKKTEDSAYRRNNTNRNKFNGLR